MSAPLIGAAGVTAVFGSAIAVAWRKGRAKNLSISRDLVYRPTAERERQIQKWLAVSPVRPGVDAAVAARGEDLAPVRGEADRPHRPTVATKRRQLVARLRVPD